MSDRVCAHPACNCRIDDSKEHCCDACQTASENQETVCGCGHEHCGH